MRGRARISLYDRGTATPSSARRRREIRKKWSSLNDRDIHDYAERAKQWKRYDRNPVVEGKGLTTRSDVIQFCPGGSIPKSRIVSRLANG
jgi:hypothetical protein